MFINNISISGLIVLTLSTVCSASAEEVDYLCKVTGSTSFFNYDKGKVTDIDPKKINESVSVSISKNSSGINVEILGSPLVKINFRAGKSGEAITEGVFSTRNNSSGSTISLENKINLESGTSNDVFKLNSKTKFIYVNSSHYSGMSTGRKLLIDTSFSGVCK